ncbi:hypothetical protein [Nereida sp. MMG025]|uniref:hypothetical protein n=1 Tax=Nereida sp. MMG025 TaxID=2909981 RepID=UPI001F303E1B|nr:hypothetical protein [Nereida sp. MMG025]MCF6445612.1 hypothetical protein [Nereida sp. MMG025]
MKLVKIAALVTAGAFLSACGGGVLGEGGERSDKTVDKGRDEKDLSQLRAGIWVDPNGCDHWIIDDGVEGYLSQRLDPMGKPVCSGIAPPGTATGPFREGSDIPDPL